MTKKDSQIVVQWHPISFVKDTDFISLTDIAKRFDDLGLIDSWLRNKNTVEFLGAWERLNNPNFNSVEFDRIMMESGLNRFRLSVKEWNKRVNWIGLRARAGIFGGTYAHINIALEFASWVSPEFKLFVLTEFERLKTEEAERVSSGWNTKRVLAKINYKMHTDAIKANLTSMFTIDRLIYANEADMLNLIVYGETASTWKDKNKDVEWNQRDNWSVEQLILMANLESINSMLIHQKKERKERAEILYAEAKRQMANLLGDNNKSVKKLTKPGNDSPL